MHFPISFLFSLLALTLPIIARTSLSNLKRSGDAYQTILACLDDHHVNYVTQSSVDWAQYQAPFNLRLPYTPAVITLPKISQEISDTVECARLADLKVQAKSGGHSYASYSSGGRDGGVIIDLENFNSVQVDNGK
jgi:FAD/FMN-containing dehydrogenase